MYEFSLTDEDWKKIHEWMSSKKDKETYTGAIGGRLSYTFCPTSLGMVVKVKDELTGEELDLTDYEDW